MNQMSKKIAKSASNAEPTVANVPRYCDFTNTAFPV